jgi:hypothetical protein
LRLHHHRDPDLGSKEDFGSVKVARGDAEHRIWQPVDANCLSHDIRIAAELPLPVVVAKDHVRRRTGDEILTRAKESADRWPETEKVEVIPGRQLTPHRLGASATVNRHPRQTVTGNCRESAVSIPEIAVVRK